MKQSRGMSVQSLEMKESPEAGGTASSQSVSESGLHPLAAQLAPELMYWSTDGGGVGGTEGGGFAGGDGGAHAQSRCQSGELPAQLKLSAAEEL